MEKNDSSWKKGKGKLGLLEPLLGVWLAEYDSPMGKLKCTREFIWVLQGKYLQLKATWEFSNKKYQEIAMYGILENKISFWSFTSDGKKSEGQIAIANDIHPNAICFEAHMPAGIARMIYWPGDNQSMNWAVESKTKKGWNRFTEHHYNKVI